MQEFKNKQSNIDALNQFKIQKQKKLKRVKPYFQIVDVNSISIVMPKNIIVENLIN